MTTLLCHIHIEKKILPIFQCFLQFQFICYDYFFLLNHVLFASFIFIRKLILSSKPSCWINFEPRETYCHNKNKKSLSQLFHFYSNFFFIDEENCLLEKIWTIYKRRKREVLRIELNGLYSVNRMQHWFESSAKQIVFSFCRVNIPLNSGKKMLLMIRGTLSSSQRRRGVIDHAESESEIRFLRELILQNRSTVICSIFFGFIFVQIDVLSYPCLKTKNFINWNFLQTFKNVNKIVSVIMIKNSFVNK